MRMMMSLLVKTVKKEIKAYKAKNNAYWLLLKRAAKASAKNEKKPNSSKKMLRRVMEIKRTRIFRGFTALEFVKESTMSLKGTMPVKIISNAPIKTTIQ